MLSTGDTQLIQKYQQVNSKRRKKMCHVNSYQKKAGATVLTMDKIDFKTKNITRDKWIFYNNKRKIGQL